MLAGWPHLRTWRWCSEYPQATWRIRTRRCKRDQVQRRLWLCHYPFFSCSLLHSFRHYFGAACWAENADIEQMEKMVPLITCEIALCQYVCGLVSCGKCSVKLTCLTTVKGQMTRTSFQSLSQRGCVGRLVKCTQQRMQTETSIWLQAGSTRLKIWVWYVNISGVNIFN